MKGVVKNHNSKKTTFQKCRNPTQLQLVSASTYPIPRFILAPLHRKPSACFIPLNSASPHSNCAPISIPLVFPKFPSFSSLPKSIVKNHCLKSTQKKGDNTLAVPFSRQPNSLRHHNFFAKSSNSNTLYRSIPFFASLIFDSAFSELILFSSTAQ